MSIYPMPLRLRLELTVASDFNKTVNMTADELEEWLKGSGSRESGWAKEDGSGESIGHERRVSVGGLCGHLLIAKIVEERLSKFSKRIQRKTHPNMTKTIFLI